MTTLGDVLDFEELWSLLEEGYVSVRHHPDDMGYKIFSYSKKAVAHEWTPSLRECRGLIVKGPGASILATDEVIARPFAKFFNSTEPESAWFEQLPGDTHAIAYDKVDGSLGILYRAPDGKLAIATRGSFASEQAIHATNLLRTKYADFEWAMTDISLMFEVVYPENRIVLDYKGQDDLILLGCRAISNGHVYTYVIPSFWWPGPVAEELHRGTVKSVLEMGSREHREGLVVYTYGDLSFNLVKIKESEYVRLHRIVTGLSEVKVWEKLVESGLLPTWRWAEANLDAEHAEWVKNVSQDIYDKWNELVNSLLTASIPPVVNHHNDRKEFALWVNANVKEHKSAYFLILDDRFEKLYEYCWNQVKPKASDKVGSPVNREDME